MADNVLLLKPYNGDDVTGWYWSEKLDGMRAIWDGIGPRSVTFTRESPGPGKFIGTMQVTGLWSRLGKPIIAPGWFIERLPVGLALDGELYCPRLSLHNILSIVRTKKPGPGWREIEYVVFDVPRLEYTDWVTSITGFDPRVDRTGTRLEPCVSRFYVDRCSFGLGRVNLEQATCFLEEYSADGFCILKQNIVEREDSVSVLARQQYDEGGEGVVVRSPYSLWRPGRSSDSFKHKPFEILTGLVVGWKPGQGKYSGMIGSYQVQYSEGGETGELSVSGFDDTERMIGGSCRVGKKMKIKARRVGSTYVEPRFDKWV